MIEISRNNVLFGAVCGTTREDAIKIIQRALGLDADSPLLDHVPDEQEWMRMPTSLRLQKIGRWLEAECFRLGDINDDPENFVTVDDPISCGTRD